MGKPKIKEIDTATAEQIIFSREPLGLFWLKDNGVYVGIDNSTGDAWTEEFHNFTACIGWLLMNDQPTSDEPVGISDNLKWLNRKNHLKSILYPFVEWFMELCDDCNDSDACKDCQLSDLCDHGLYPSKVADAIKELLDNV